MYSQKVMFVTAMIFVCSSMGSAQNPRGTISVCDLMRKLSELDGQIVKVRGILQEAGLPTDNPHLDELVPDKCDGMDAKVLRVQVVSPDVHFLKSPPPGYKPDEASLQRAENMLKEILSKGHTVRRLSVTVEGYLIVSKPDLQLQEPSRAPRHRTYPAYIVLQAIRDVKVL